MDRIDANAAFAQVRIGGLRPGTAGGCLACAGLVLLCLVVYVPGFFSIPAVDRDESRFAQASRQMLESRSAEGWIVPRIQDSPRLNKPPLIYWAQAGAAGFFTAGRPWNDAIWMYRIPSLLAAVGAVLATWRLGSAMFDGRTGRLGAALLAVCPIMAWEARQARADMLLVFLTATAMLALWKLWTAAPAEAAPASPVLGRDLTEVAREALAPPARSASWRWMLILWSAVGLGVLTKGPITPMIVALAVLTLAAAMRREEGWRRIWRIWPLTGAAIVILLVAPWVVLVGGRIGWDVYLPTVWEEVFGRSLSPREGHWGPPGYHLVLLPVLFWPGSLLTALGLALAFAQARSFIRGRAGEAVRRGQPESMDGRGGEASLFCLAWIAPAWLIFEIIGTKLPHYTMPLYPALALLSARAVLAADAGLLRGLGTRAARAGLLAWAIIGLGISGAGLVIVIAAEQIGGGGGRIVAGFAAIIALLWGAWSVRLAVRSFRAGRFTRAQLAGTWAMVIVCVFVLGLVLSRIDDLWISRQIARHLEAADPAGRRPLAAAEYHEDSLVFLTRGRVERIGAEDTADWLERNPEGLLVVPSDMVPDRAAPIAGVSGFNYSRGRTVHLTVVERRR